MATSNSLLHITAHALSTPKVMCKQANAPFLGAAYKGHVISVKENENVTFFCFTLNAVLDK